VSDSVAVQIAIGLDLSDLDRPLEAAELVVLKEYREKILKFIRQQWTGWKYVGRTRESKGRSLAGWKGHEQSTEGIREIVIENEATGYYSGKAYVEFVRRSKGRTPEAEVLAEIIGKQITPLLVTSLLDAILETIESDGPPKKVRENKSSTYSTMTLGA
jgi:hypothetical protein